MSDIAGPFTLPPELLRNYLEQLLAHPAWPGSARRSALLRHLVTETLAGRGARLKGSAIATDMFGTPMDSPLQSDAIVRVEAGRLRRDLDSYYVRAGRDDPVRISIPKGGYRAVFGLVDPPGTSVSGSAAPMRRDPASDMPAVLVRPFVALGADETLRNIAMGLTHEVTSELMGFPGFRLYSTEDSFGLAEAPPGRTAEPDDKVYSVRGAIQSEGAEMKVSVRLSRAGNGRVVWSQTFTRPLAARSLMTVQSEIAADIASALGAPASSAHEGLIARIARSDAPSMDSYLAVLAAQAYRRTNMRNAYAATRAALEQAVLCDPGYADAWAYLAFLRLDGQRFGHDPQAAPGDFGLAMAAARRAVALDPDSICGHLALLLVEHYAGNAAAALATAEQALRIRPNDADVLAAMGWLRVIGHNDPAGLAYMEQALAHAVNPPPRYFRTIAIHHMMWDDSQAFFDAAQRAAADGFAVSAALLAIACGRLGRMADASAALDTMARLSPALAADPVAAAMLHHTHPAIIATIEAGLRHSGWAPRQTGPPQTGQPA